MASPPPPPPKPAAFSPTPAQYDYDRPAPPTPARPHESTQQYSQPGPQPNPMQPPNPVPTPQERWLPETLKDKSKPDLEHLLHTPSLLTALLHAPATSPSSLASAEAPLQSQLQSNIALATQVKALESQIQSLRSSLTPSLLRTSALERQFRAKQEEMDHALSPWAPKAVHTRLGQGISEQEAWCRAMEESFLEGEGGGGGGAGEGRASDREVAEWVRRYREGRKVAELRREKRMRLEEGRVGGWR